MKKIKSLFLELEKNILDWSYRDRIKIFRFLAITVSLKLISSIPYLNLVVSPAFVLYIVSILAMIIFDVNLKSLIVFCFLLFLFALGFTLIGAIESGEAVGNFIYFVFIYITVKYIFDEA